MNGSKPVGPPWPGAPQLGLYLSQVTIINTLMGGKGSGSVSSSSVSSGTGSLILISTEVGEGAFDLDAVIEKDGPIGFYKGIRCHGCQMAIARFLESYAFGPLGFWTMAPLRCDAKFDPFLSLDCARVEGVGAQSKFAIWQPCSRQAWPPN